MSPELSPPPSPAIECHSEGGLLQALRELLEEQLLPSHAEATSDDVGLEINKPVIISRIGTYKSSPVREGDGASYQDSGIAAVGKSRAPTNQSRCAMEKCRRAIIDS